MKKPKTVATNDARKSVHNSSGLKKDRAAEVRFPIIGMGASAGGLEAFELFFKTMPADSGMAFVLVPHLDPSHTSMLSEILQRNTTMPVIEVQDNAPECPPDYR